MSREQAVTSNNVYYQVFSGAFRTKVREGEPGALERVNKNGKQVYEREVKAVFGIIENVEFEDTDFGKQLRITLDKNDDGQNPVLSFGVESKDGRDVMKKLPGIDFKREVRIMPYKFIGEDGKETSGIAIHQQGETDEFAVKVKNHFFNETKKEFINGYPTIDWDNSTESAQKIWKIQRDEFLVNYVTTKVLPKFGKATTADPVEALSEAVAPEEDPADAIPF